MPATYDSIETVTLTTPGTVTFNNIPGTFTDLIISINGKTNGGPSTGNMRMTFNGDSSSAYNTQRLLGDGSGAGAERQNSVYFMAGDINNAWFVSTIHIFDYANTSYFKTGLASTGNASAYLGVYSGTWRNTNAITSISFTADGTVLGTDTTATLYGIKSA